MKPEFRENMYTAFATVHLASMAKSASQMAGALRMPTQLEESTLGYDGSMTVGHRVVYLQYKVPDYLKTRNAKQYAHYGEPYYRFKVKTDMANGFIQHNVLRELQINNPNAIVRYCAPIFHTTKQLADIHFSTISSPAQSFRRAHYLSGTSAYGVLDHSALLSPLILDEVDKDSVHVITYSASSSRALSFSDPKEGWVESLDHVLVDAFSRLESSTLHDVLSRIISEMQEAIDSSIEKDRRDSDLPFDAFPQVAHDRIPLVAKLSNDSERSSIAEVLRLSDMLGVQPLIWVQD